MTDKITANTERSGAPTQTEVVDALRRLVSFGPAGHKSHPLDETGQYLARMANEAAGEHRHSEVCSSCHPQNDHAMIGDKTLGEHTHARYEAWAYAEALLRALDAYSGSDIDA